MCCFAASLKDRQEPDPSLSQAFRRASHGCRDRTQADAADAGDEACAAVANMITNFNCTKVFYPVGRNVRFILCMFIDECRLRREKACSLKIAEAILATAFALRA